MKPRSHRSHFEERWEDMRPEAHRRWPEISDLEFSLIDGQKDMLVGVLQEHYWVSREEAERQAAEFERDWRPKAA